MTKRKDLGSISGASDKRIVWRNGSIVAQAKRFAVESVGILSLLRVVVAMTDAHMDHAVFAKGNSRRVSGLDSRKDIAYLDERLSVPAATRQSDNSVGRLVVGKVDKLVFGKLGMQSEVHQPGQTLCSHFGNTGDGSRFEHAIAEDPQAAGTFSNKDAPIRQERHAEGLVESLGYEQLDVALD